MKHALKEWNSTIETLGSGQVIAIWRKGGLEDNPSVLKSFESFNTEQNQFILFPTITHQNTNKVKTTYWNLLSEKSGPNKDNQVKVKYWAEVEEEIEPKSQENLLNISSELINSDEYLISSWNLNQDHKGKILLLRVYKLLNPILIPNAPEYDGCKSWIDLKIDIPKIGSKAVLSYKEFNQKVRLVNSLLEQMQIPQKIPV